MRSVDLLLEFGELVCALTICVIVVTSRGGFETVGLWERLTFDASGEIIILSSADQVAPSNVAVSLSYAFIHPFIRS